MRFSDKILHCFPLLAHRSSVLIASPKNHVKKENYSQLMVLFVVHLWKVSVLGRRCYFSLRLQNFVLDYFCNVKKNVGILKPYLSKRQPVGCNRCSKRNWTSHAFYLDGQIILSPLKVNFNVTVLCFTGFPCYCVSRPTRL